MFWTLFYLSGLPLAPLKTDARGDGVLAALPAIW